MASDITTEQSEVVAAVDMKSLGDAPAFFQNQMYAHAVESAKGWTSINQSIVGKITENIGSTSASEGGADLATLGMLIKALQSIQPSGVA